MQEIEIKFKVDNLAAVKDKLVSLGCELSDPLRLKDTVFLPDINNTSNAEGQMFIRIRQANEEIEVNLKKQSKQIMQSKEIEFSVSSYDAAYDFLTTLGLTEWVTVEKNRIATKYKDYNICLDDVKKLGTFVEIEIITDEEDKTEIFETQIINAAKELGINPDTRINKHYDTMIHELNG